MHRDITAVVDIGARRVGGFDHRRQHLIRHGPGHGGHRRHELHPAVRGTGAVHPAGHRAQWHRAHLLPQQRQFGDQFGQHGLKPGAGGGKGGVAVAIGPDHQINRAMLQVQARSVPQQRGCGAGHETTPGQTKFAGLLGSFCPPATRRTAAPTTDATGCTRSTWPPSRA